MQSHFLRLPAAVGFAKAKLSWSWNTFSPLPNRRLDSTDVALFLQAIRSTHEAAKISYSLWWKKLLCLPERLPVKTLNCWSSSQEEKKKTVATAQELSVTRVEEHSVVPTKEINCPLHQVAQLVLVLGGFFFVCFCFFKFQLNLLVFFHPWFHITSEALSEVSSHDFLLL